MTLNIMKISGHSAVIKYDPEIEMFRGEFTDLNGGADFYADNVKDLRKEGEISLKVYLDMCKEQGMEPYKQYSGRFVLRLDKSLHAGLTAKALAKGVSLNTLIVEDLQELATS